MGIHDIWLFVMAGILLNVTPGPDMALVIARSTQYGARAGIAAALGIGAGALLHIAAAAIGISTVLMASAWAFTAVKWAGALYLIYLGARMLWSTALPPPSTATGPSSGGSMRKIFMQGVLTNALNPKVAIFFLAFLPQFIDATSPAAPLAFVTLGLIFDATGTVWNIVVAIVAGRLGSSALGGLAKLWLERLIGALFVGVGLKLALSERP